MDAPPETNQSSATSALDVEQLRRERESILENLTFVRNEMTRTMQDMSRISNRGSSTLLLFLGATALLIAFLFKLNPFGARFTSLSSGEFVAVIVIAMVLLLVGSAIRLYQFKKEQEAGKRIRDFGMDLLFQWMALHPAEEPPPTRDDNA